MQVIIDRFEGEYAIVELPDQSTIELHRKLLEPDAREGDVVAITLCPEERAKREREIADLMKDVFKSEE